MPATSAGSSATRARPTVSSTTAAAAASTTRRRWPSWTSSWSSWAISSPSRSGGPSTCRVLRPNPLQFGDVAGLRLGDVHLHGEVRVHQLLGGFGVAKAEQVAEFVAGGRLEFERVPVFVVIERAEHTRVDNRPAHVGHAQRAEGSVDPLRLDQDIGVLALIYAANQDLALVLHPQVPGVGDQVERLGALDILGHTRIDAIKDQVVLGEDRVGDLGDRVRGQRLLVALVSVGAVQVRVDHAQRLAAEDMVLIQAGDLLKGLDPIESCLNALGDGHVGVEHLLADLADPQEEQQAALQVLGMNRAVRPDARKIGAPQRDQLLSDGDQIGPIAAEDVRQDSGHAATPVVESSSLVAAI